MEGEYQGVVGFDGKSCTPCPDGEWTGELGALSCKPCSKPHCAASVLTCNKKTGDDQTFATYAAESVVCAIADAADPCDSPEYCSSLVAQCDNSTNVRYPMLTTLPPCAGDALHGVDCWGVALTYEAAPLALTVQHGPPTSATCNSVAVPSRVRYFFAAQASMPHMACPAVVDLHTSWWGSQLDTLHESPLLSSGSAYTFELSGGQIAALQGQAVHVIAQFYEPVSEIPTAHVCLERMIVDSSPPAAATLACPLASEAAQTALVAPTAPCYSEKSEVTYYAPST